MTKRKCLLKQIFVETRFMVSEKNFAMKSFIDNENVSFLIIMLITINYYRQFLTLIHLIFRKGRILPGRIFSEIDIQYIVRSIRKSLKLHENFMSSQEIIQTKMEVGIRFRRLICA